MDLKSNFAGVWPLRDKLPLPITALEVIKDSTKFLTLASSVLLAHALFFKFSIPDA